jgi:hypothetical protein
MPASTFIGTIPGDMVPGRTGMPDILLPAGFPGGPSGAGATAPPSAGNGWEIRVVSGLDYVTMLAWIPPSMLINFQFARMLDDIGSGTVVLDQDDLWWTAVTLPGGLPAHTLLDEECLWQVYQDGVCRFEFFGETVTEQLVDSSEQRQVTITGPGTIAALKWAMIAPLGFPNIVQKVDSIQDSFDEVNVSGQGVLDTNIWTTASPSSHVYITPVQPLYAYPGGSKYALSTLYPSGSLTVVASPSTTFLGASPYDATDTLMSAQVTPIGVSSTTSDATTPAAYGTGLNGSEVTQFYIQSNKASGNYAMFGLSASAFYAQVGSPGIQTKVLPAYDSTNHAYWMITEQGGSGGGPGTFYFWTSPDGQNWTQQWSVVHNWDATNVTFYVAAAYSVDSTESAQITNLNSNVTTPSYQGNIYLGVPLMGVWYSQFTQAQGRGTIPFIDTLATGSADSYGRAWADVENVQTTNGTDLYSFLQSATSVVNADFVMDPGFTLRVGQPATGQVALGVDRSQYLILREGYDAMAKQRQRMRNQITTLVGGENTDGHEISASSPTYIAQWGQREAWYQAAVQIDPTSMAYATAASLAQNETEILSWTFTITPNLPGRTVFENFDVGDWLGLERPDFSAVDAVRVTGIAVQVDSTGTETHELTFISYIQWLQEQLTYLANKLGGAFVNALGATPVAPSQYGTGQVPTYFTPAASLTQMAGASAGSSISNAPLVYNPATGNYQNAGTTDPVSGNLVPATVASPAGSSTVSPTSVLVNTGTGSTLVGLQSDGSVTTVDTGGTAPATPDTPTVTGAVQGLTISWDGLLAGAGPLSNFQLVQFHLSTTSGFTPSSATLLTTAVKEGSVSVTGLLPGTTYYAKLVAVTTSGMTSAASAQASGVAQGLPTSDLTGQLPASLLGNSAGSWALNPNPFFNGGDLTGWFVTNGTLTATQSVPAGAPGGPPWCAHLVSTAANCLVSGSPTPFPVVPGQPYVMTAWVYNPGGSAVNVAIGFNWTGGTSTFSVPAGTWTPLAVVSNAPVGVTSAYQVLGPTASGVTINITAAVAAGQVPGALIAAQSVTANQIAAGTITASQIAASTITAAQLAANTITAAKIAANTITAAQIAAGTITATQINASTVVAGIVNGTEIDGSVFRAKNGSGATVMTINKASGTWLQYLDTGSATQGYLVASSANVAGTDEFGYAYLAGTVTYTLISGTYYAVQNYGGNIVFSSTTSTGGPWATYSSFQPDTFAGFIAYFDHVGNKYNVGHYENSGNTNQLINSTSAADVTGSFLGGLSANSWHGKWEIFYTGNQAAGTAIFNLTLEGGAVVTFSFVEFFFWTANAFTERLNTTTGTFNTQFAGPTLIGTSSVQRCSIESWFTLSTAGNVGVAARDGTSGDTFNILYVAARMEKRQ